MSLVVLELILVLVSFERAQKSALSHRQGRIL